MTALSFAELELAYERLATAIDQAGPENEVLLLTKLALALAHHGGDLALFTDCIEMALLDVGDVDRKHSPLSKRGAVT